MLTADQLEHLIAEYGDASHHMGTSSIAAARAQIAAMQTPITAEALTRTGWREIYQSSNALMFKNAGRTIYAIGDRPRFEISFWQDGETEMYCGFAQNARYTVPMPSNMYDLSELVRLLGGGE